MAKKGWVEVLKAGFPMRDGERGRLSPIVVVVVIVVAVAELVEVVVKGGGMVVAGEVPAGGDLERSNADGSRVEVVDGVGVGLRGLFDGSGVTDASEFAVAVADGDRD